MDEILQNHKEWGLYRSKKLTDVNDINPSSLPGALMSKLRSWMTVQGLQLLCDRMGQKNVSYAGVYASVLLYKKQGHYEHSNKKTSASQPEIVISLWYVKGQIYTSWKHMT